MPVYNSRRVCPKLRCAESMLKGTRSPKETMVVEQRKVEAITRLQPDAAQEYLLWASASVVTD
jgi:hypothetical protein